MIILTNKRKKPKRRKKSIGPARSESSMMCWSTLAMGLSTVSVCPNKKFMVNFRMLPLDEEP